MLGMPSPWAVRLITAKQMLPEQTHPGLGYLGLQSLLLALLHL